MNAFFSKHNNKTGWMIWLLNFLAAAGSSWFFLGKAKLPFIAWICYNPCALSAIVFMAGFALKRKEVLAAALPFLLFYSITGLIIFDWNRVFLEAQTAHIFMICAICYSIRLLYSAGEKKKIAAGFFTGLILFSIFLPLQQRYVKEHQGFAENFEPDMRALITKQKGLF